MPTTLVTTQITPSNPAVPATPAAPVISLAPAAPNPPNLGQTDEDRRTSRIAADRGQSTVEYALLVVGIATLALLVLAWASSTDVVGALFDRVFRWVTGRVG